jgi:hypothetical protein
VVSVDVGVGVGVVELVAGLPPQAAIKATKRKALMSRTVARHGPSSKVSARNREVQL